MNITLNGINVKLFKISTFGILNSAVITAKNLFEEYLKKTVGESEKPKATSGEILIGMDDSLPGDYDGVFISLDGNKLLITGSNYRSVIYAVLVFFEKYIGWRFLTPDCEILTLKDDLSLRDFSYSYTSPFQYRLVLYQRFYSNDFYVKMKINSQFACDLPEKYGKGIFYAYGKEKEPFYYSAHTMGVYLPSEKYFEKHPEYFSLIDGVRCKDQPCLSNSEVFDLILKGVFETLENTPEAKIVSVTQNDGENFCHCEKCMANIKKYHTQGANEFLFVNRIAKAVAKKYPDVLVETMPYNYSTEPPVNFRFEKNVSVRIALMRMCREHTLTDASCQYNVKMQKFFRNWSKLSDNIYLWDYTANFRFYILPINNFKLLYQNMRFYRQFSVKGIMYQFEHDSDGDTCFAELWAYIQSKLLWEPDMSYTTYIGLIKEFLRLYYGDGWENLYDYIVLASNQPSSDYHYGPYAKAENLLPFRNDGNGKVDTVFIDDAKTLYGKAKEKATHEQADRIDKSMLHLDYYELCALYDYAMHSDEENKRKYREKYTAFNAKMQKYSIKKIGEGKCFKSEYVENLVDPNEI